MERTLACGSRRPQVGVRRELGRRGQTRGECIICRPVRASGQGCGRRRLARRRAVGTMVDPRRPLRASDQSADERDMSGALAIAGLLVLLTAACTGGLSTAVVPRSDVVGRVSRTYVDES